ncbi:unnamed protein product, partial [Choristocarpus tenellus]
MQRSTSIEHFRPDFFSAHRQGSVTSSLVTLLGTVLGGGVLSIPFALRRSGLVLGIFVLIITAIATDFSVFTLISCSRRSGASTYEAVADHAFGRQAKLLCMGLVVCVTYLPLIAYTILLRDLLSPIVELAIGEEMSMTDKNVMVTVFVALVFPACTIKSLNALRHLSLCSIFASFLLATTVTTRSIQCVGSEGVPLKSINLWPEDGLLGALQGVPIFVCAFVCHFNVLPVHSELAKPTRQRLHKMV